MAEGARKDPSDSNLEQWSSAISIQAELFSAQEILLPASPAIAGPWQCASSGGSQSQQLRHAALSYAWLRQAGAERSRTSIQSQCRYPTRLLRFNVSARGRRRRGVASSRSRRRLGQVDLATALYRMGIVEKNQSYTVAEGIGSTTRAVSLLRKSCKPLQRTPAIATASAMRWSAPVCSPSRQVACNRQSPAIGKACAVEKVAMAAPLAPIRVNG